MNNNKLDSKKVIITLYKLTEWKEITHLFLILKILKKEKHGWNDSLFYQKQDNISCRWWISLRYIPSNETSLDISSNTLRVMSTSNLNRLDGALHLLNVIIIACLLSIQLSCEGMNSHSTPHQKMQSTPHHSIAHYPPYHTTTIHTPPLLVTSHHNTTGAAVTRTSACATST